MIRKKLSKEERLNLINSLKTSPECKKIIEEAREEFEFLNTETKYSQEISRIEEKMKKALQRKIELYCDFCEYKGLIFYHILEVQKQWKG